MGFTLSILRTILAPRAILFDKATKDPSSVQKKILLSFIKRHKNTSYGREHSFGRIDSIDEYRKAVPINSYEALRPYVDRLMKGEKNILTIDDPFMLGTTSGTTGKPKYIPVTKYSKKKKKEVMNIWIYHILSDHPDIFKGKILAVVSPEFEKFAECGLPCGSESGHVYKNIPSLVKRFYVLPHSIFQIKDYESKYYAILRLALEDNISAIATLNPSTLVLLCRKMNDLKEKIIDDIERGSLNGDCNIEPHIRSEIEKRLRPNPKRAAVLKNILKEKGGLRPVDIWPDLKLIKCWKGGSMGMYLKEFPKYFGDVPIRDFGYISSEARCSIPTDNARCCGILAVQANFYEFLPKESRETDEKKTFLCHELELGKEYFIIITTPGGLYRYDIDDVVKVVGFHNKTPRIEFVQKGINVTSLTGEKLYESHVIEAVKNAVHGAGVHVEFFTACIEWAEIPRYVFLVELRDSVHQNKKKDLLRFIDDQIKVLNIEYDAKRKSERLGDPVLKIVKRGAFNSYRATKVASGAHDGQFKLPQLTKDLCFQNNFAIEEEIYLKK
ncbi:MAG: GH3 auxin-responsive promoter family protein [Candidatus Omnitrophota bacterium]